MKFLVMCGSYRDLYNTHYFDKGLYHIKEIESKIYEITVNGYCESILYSIYCKYPYTHIVEKDINPFTGAEYYKLLDN